MKNLLYTIFILLVAFNANSQISKSNKPVADKQCRMNIYIISKDTKKEILPFTVKVRAVFKSLFSKKRMRVIVSSKSEFAAAKIDRLLKKHHAIIGNLWFDSHGLYKNGFSSFTIGTDNFNYKNITDSTHTAFLQQIARHTDEHTKIGIGSCYGGATFIHPGSATVKSGPMKGDSLMIGMGKIFNGSTIYASGGWVMMKPGIFSDNFGFAGYPLGKKYRTQYWRPVWDHLGEWYAYSTQEGFIKTVNTVALSRLGEIKVRERNYLSLNKAIRKQEKALATIQP